MKPLKSWNLPDVLDHLDLCASTHWLFPSNLSEAHHPSRKDFLCPTLSSPGGGGNERPRLSCCKLWGWAMWHVALIKFIMGKELPLTSNAFLAKIEINGGRFQSLFGESGSSEARPRDRFWQKWQQCLVSISVTPTFTFSIQLFKCDTRHLWAVYVPPFVTWRATQGVSWIWSDTSSPSRVTFLE